MGQREVWQQKVEEVEMEREQNVIRKEELEVCIHVLYVICIRSHICTCKYTLPLLKYSMARSLAVPIHSHA